MSKDVLDSGFDTNPYPFSRIGNYGRFRVGKSFPIDYLMTTFTSEELNKLSFARDVKTGTRDFAMLMQRDIDEERVKNDMQPYLAPDESIKIDEQALFFPPLLVAVVPVDGNVMNDYFPHYIDDNSNSERFTREWREYFKLTLRKSEEIGSYAIEQKGGDKVNVLRDPARIEFRIGSGNKGVKLIVIDGQHRLAALNLVNNVKNGQLLNEMVVPVCVLFPPESFYDVSDSQVANRPKVTNVFRKLFVDVNNTAELVGGHFNILLSDNHMGALACRGFCTKILENNGNEGTEKLSVIEWNTKKKKDSTVITKKYSITSIGVIEKALRDEFAKNKLILKYLLKLGDVESKLYPEPSEKGSSEYPEVSWDSFSLHQKPFVQEQIDKSINEFLETLFFEVEAFKKSYQIFLEELKKIKVNADDSTVGITRYQPVLNYILDYDPIEASKEYKAARVEYANFGSNFEERRDKECGEIIKFALFQRSIFSVWVRILHITKKLNLEPNIALNISKHLLNDALDNNGNFFDFKNSYMQYAVFTNNRIQAREDSKKSLSLLLLSWLGSKKLRQIISDVLKDELEKEIIEKLLEELCELGKNSASNYILKFKIARAKHFQKSYAADMSLSSEDREELLELEELQKTQLSEVRNGLRLKDNVDDSFEVKISEYVKEFVEIASFDLQKALGFQFGGFSDTDDEVDEED